MRPWMIVLASVIAAIVVTAVLAGPSLLAASGSDFASILRPRLSLLAVAALAAYGLSAALLASGVLVTSALAIRHRLDRVVGHRTPGQPNWMAAFGSTGLHRLVQWQVADPNRRGAAAETILLQDRFSTSAARSEVARLYYIWLARTHFFSALMVLGAFAGLGVAQDHGPVPVLLSGIPTVAAMLILAGLVLLAVLGRIALDVSAEPLIEAISQLAAEPPEVGVLRRVAEVLDAVRTAPAVNVDAASSPPQLSDRIEMAIEEGQRSLVDAARHLSATTDAVGAAIASSIDTLKTAIGAISAQLPPLAEHSHAAAGFSELQSAIEALTAVLEQLTSVPAVAEEASLGADQGAPRRVRTPGLARELRALLREIEAAR